MSLRSASVRRCTQESRSEDCEEEVRDSAEFVMLGVSASIAETVVVRS